MLKTALSRQNHQNADARVLNEQHVEQHDADHFDSFYSRMRLAYYADNDDNARACTFLCFSKHACCKHIVRLKKRALGILASETHDIAVLTLRAKRGQRKKHA